MSRLSGGIVIFSLQLLAFCAIVWGVPPSVTSKFIKIYIYKINLKTNTASLDSIQNLTTINKNPFQLIKIN